MTIMVVISPARSLKEVSRDQAFTEDESHLGHKQQRRNKSKDERKSWKDEAARLEIF